MRGQVRGSIYEGFDLAAVTTVVDIGRHQAEIYFGHTATRPHGLVEMSSFQTLNCVVDSKFEFRYKFKT